MNNAPWSPSCSIHELPLLNGSANLKSPVNRLHKSGTIFKLLTKYISQDCKLGLIECRAEGITNKYFCNRRDGGCPTTNHSPVDDNSIGNDAVPRSKPAPIHIILIERDRFRGDEYFIWRRVEVLAWIRIRGRRQSATASIDCGSGKRRGLGR